MLATKPPFAGSSISTAGLAANTIQPGGLPTARRIPNIANPPATFASPTESEFSESDGPDSVKNWDEDRVCDYLVSVKCGEYEKLFRKNHINGENLLEMDKDVLKEMGIEKVGDRVRLFLCIKKLRTKAYANQKKRNRVCFFAGLLVSIRLCQLINPGLVCCPRTHLDIRPRRLPPPSEPPLQQLQHHSSRKPKILETNRRPRSSRNQPLQQGHITSPHR